MIKLSKDGKPVGEFFSIYNAINELQLIMSNDTPDVIYPSTTSISLLVNSSVYRLDTETEKQVKSVVKWIDSFGFTEVENAD
jgi:hypothetical protein